MGKVQNNIITLNETIQGAYHHQTEVITKKQLWKHVKLQEAIGYKLMTPTISVSTKKIGSTAIFLNERLRGAYHHQREEKQVSRERTCPERRMRSCNLIISFGISR